MTKQQNLEALANDIYEWCEHHGIWEDCTIYFNGKALSDSERWNGEYGEKIGNNLYLYENKNPRDYMKYANQETLSMAFDGLLYDVVNDFGQMFPRMYDEFEKLFDKHGYYYELGSNWYLNASEK